MLTEPFRSWKGGHRNSSGYLPINIAAANTTGFDYGTTGFYFSTSGKWSGETSSVGGNETHTHDFTGTQVDIPTVSPYITVYMYKRTA